MTDDNEGGATLSVRLPADLLRHAKAVARGRDETMSQVIRRLLRSYVQSGPKQLDLEEVVAVSRRSPAKRTEASKPNTKAGAAKSGATRRRQ
jgi:metal-responsive CopG/Arc/MetJ family transcriptional regulator